MESNWKLNSNNNVWYNIIVNNKLPYGLNLKLLNDIKSYYINELNEIMTTNNTTSTTNATTTINKMLIPNAIVLLNYMKTKDSVFKTHLNVPSNMPESLPQNGTSIQTEAEPIAIGSEKLLLNDLNSFLICEYLLLNLKQTYNQSNLQNTSSIGTSNSNMTYHYNYNQQQTSLTTILLMWFHEVLNNNNNFETINYLENTFINFIKTNSYELIFNNNNSINIEAIPNSSKQTRDRQTNTQADTQRDSNITLLEQKNLSNVFKSELNSLNYSFQYITTLYQSIIINYRYSQLFDIIFNLFVYILTDNSNSFNNSPIIIARILKSLNLLIRSDIKLFNKLIIKQIIIKYITDSSISVREETIKIIGYLLLSNININDYLLILKDSLFSDVGISVRKSVILILQNILLNQLNHINYLDICIILLQYYYSNELKEELTIKELIINIFIKIWFTPQTYLQTNLQTQSNSNQTSLIGKKSKKLTKLDNLSLVSPNSNRKSKTNEYILQITNRLVDIVLLYNNSNKLLINLIRNLLNNNNNITESNSINESVINANNNEKLIYENHCYQIINCLIELLLQCEEKRVMNIQSDIPTPASVVTDPDSHQNVNEIVAIRTNEEWLIGIFLTISIFCQSHPILFIKYLLLFIPYLKIDINSNYKLNFIQENLIYSHVCEMISACCVIDDAIAILKPRSVTFDF